jgi:multiple sugar transport system substrate-binding protein
MKKPNLIILCLVLVTGIYLAACQPATVEVTPVVEGEVVAETITEEVPVTGVVVAECPIDPPAAPVAVTYLGWSFPLFDQYLSYLDACRGVSNVTVNVLQMDNQSAIEQMSLAFASGGASPYAIVHQSNSSIQSNVWKGWLTPLSDLVEKYREEYNLDDIDQGMWDGATFDGEIYGVPMGANAIMLMYREDLFDKNNLEVPTTYDEIIAACHVLKDEPGIDIPFAMDLSAGWAWGIAFREALVSLGGDLFVEGTNEPAFNSPEGVAALEKIMEVVDGCMGAEGLTYGSGAMSAGLGNGSVAFIHTWASSGVSLTDPERSDMWDQIAFAPAASVEPGGKLAGSAWGDFWAIPASYQGDVDLVFRLILEAGRADHQAEAVDLGMVTRTSALQSEGALAFAPAALETIANGVGATPRRIATPTMNASLDNWLPFLGTGEMSPEEVLQAAEEEYIREATAAGYLE